MTEGLIARDDAGGPVALGYDAALDWPRGERRSYRELWAAGVLVVLIGIPVAVLLEGELQGRAVRTVGIAVILTAIWFLALRRTASLARARGLEPIVAAAMGTAVGLVVASLLNYWVLETAISPSKLLAMAACVFVLAGSFQAVASRGVTARPRVVIVGANGDTSELVHDLSNGKNRRFHCLGVVAKRRNGIELPGAPYLGGSSDLIKIVRRDRPELIVCSTPNARRRTVDRLLDAGITTVRVLDSREFHEYAFRRVGSRQLSTSWFAGVLDIHHPPYSARVKRAFDVVVAGIALILMSPLFLVVPLLIRCYGPGGVLFRQVRSGEGGELFEMLKFRTMVPDAEADEAIWALEDDPRVTPIGRFLRKTRLDEVPQLWNVLRGEMSIVGPRPERPEFLDLLRKEVPFWTRRHLLRPGITGWAQVQLAYTDDVSGAASKLSYDLYYLKHRSLALDLLILIKTFKVILTGRGAR